jgi:DNA-binding NarL/FixJ family response regulator
MDINMPGMSGVECTRRLKNSLPEVQIIMLTVYENTDHIFSALEAGASGYLLRVRLNNQFLHGRERKVAG